MASDIGFEDDFAPTPELRKSMMKILQAADTWRRAVSGSDAQDMWFTRIDAVKKEAQNVYNIMTDELVFPGKSQQAAYNVAIKSFLDLQDDIQFSKDQLPRPDLVDQAKDFVSHLTDFPADVITGIGDAFQKAVGAAAGAFSGSLTEVVKKLWPWALGLAVVVVAVQFGPRIVKAVK